MIWCFFFLDEKKRSNMGNTTFFIINKVIGHIAHLRNISFHIIPACWLKENKKENWILCLFWEKNGPSLDKLNPCTKEWSVLSTVEYWPMGSEEEKLLCHFILCCYHLSFEKGMSYHLNRPTAYSLYHRILCAKFGGIKLVQWLRRRKVYNVVESF